MFFKASPRAALAINLAILAAGSSLMLLNWVHSRRAAATPSAGDEPELHAPATVASVALLPAAPDASSSAPRMRVCFTIDSFAAIASRDRSFYETMERDRQAAHGPRCLLEPARAFPESLHPGDRLDAIFTPEDGGKITVKELIEPQKDPAQK